MLKAMVLINIGPSLVWRQLHLIKSVVLYINYGTDLNNLGSTYLFFQSVVYILVQGDNNNLLQI